MIWLFCESLRDLEQGMCLVIVEGEAAFTIGCVGSIILVLIILGVTWNDSIAISCTTLILIQIANEKALCRT